MKRIEVVAVLGFALPVSAQQYVDTAAKAMISPPSNSCSFTGTWMAR